MRETRKCRASPRALRWVASGGRVFSVASRILCSSSEVSIRRDRCRFGDWPRASQPPREKASRAGRTVGLDNPVCCAMAWLESPWLASRMMRHSRATLCGVVPAPRTLTVSSELSGTGH
jgi:hypothetical protein